MAHGHTNEASPHTTGRTIRWAHLYNILFGRKPTEVHKQAVRIAAPQPAEKALDVGCGPGTIAVALSRKVAPGGEVVGIDASIEMIEVARKKAEKAESDARFEPAAIESLPFPDATFDLATSTFMLHHLPEDVQAKGLAEVRRVLKPGGRLVIADFSSESGSFLGHILSVLGHGHGGSTYPALEARLKAAGFASVEEIASNRKESLIVKAS